MMFGCVAAPLSECICNCLLNWLCLVNPPNLHTLLENLCVHALLNFYKLGW